MVDVRRELSLINKHIRQHNRDAGETVVWYQFVPLGDDPTEDSTYDYIFDQGPMGEGGRRYAPGIVIPTFTIEEVEDQFTRHDDGRQPVQNIHIVMLYDDVRKAGMQQPWEYKEHLNDLVFYDSRYYKVKSYRVRGRLEDEVVVGVNAFEVMIDQEYTFDYPPPYPVIRDLPWPNTLP